MVPVHSELAIGAGERLHLDFGPAMETLEAASPPDQDGHEPGKPAAIDARYFAESVEKDGQTSVDGKSRPQQGAEEVEAVGDDDLVLRERIEQLPRPEIRLSEAEQGVHVELQEHVVHELEGQAVERAGSHVGEGPLEGRADGVPDLVVRVRREVYHGAAELVAVVGCLLYDGVDLVLANRVLGTRFGGFWLRHALLGIVHLRYLLAYLLTCPIMACSFGGDSGGDDVYVSICLVWTCLACLYRLLGTRESLHPWNFQQGRDR